jgi:hypothetical protein
MTGVAVAGAMDSAGKFQQAMAGSSYWVWAFLRKMDPATEEVQ